MLELFVYNVTSVILKIRIAKSTYSQSNSCIVLHLQAQGKAVQNSKECSSIYFSVSLHYSLTSVLYVVISSMVCYCLYVKCRESKILHSLKQTLLMLFNVTLLNVNCSSLNVFLCGRHSQHYRAYT